MLQMSLEVEHICKKWLLQEVAKPWHNSTDIACQHTGALLQQTRAQCGTVGHAVTSPLHDVKITSIP